MVIKLILKTGKEIELTKAEYDELKEELSALSYVTISTPFFEPYKPYWQDPQYKTEITCEAE